MKTSFYFQVTVLICSWIDGMVLCKLKYLLNINYSKKSLSSLSTSLIKTANCNYKIICFFNVKNVGQKQTKSIYNLPTISDRATGQGNKGITNFKLAIAAASFACLIKRAPHPFSFVFINRSSGNNVSSFYLSLSFLRGTRWTLVTYSTQTTLCTLTVLFFSMIMRNIIVFFIYVCLHCCPCCTGIFLLLNLRKICRHGQM